MARAARSRRASLELNMKNLTNALVDVSDWETLGIQLGVKKSKVKEIGIDRNYRSPHLSKIDVLDFWLRNDLVASWEKLAIALDAMDEREAARVVRTTYCSSATCQEFYGQGTPSSRQDTATRRTEKANLRPSMDDFLTGVKTPNWFRLGLKLRIPEADMKLIKKDHRDSKDALEKVCEAYLDEVDRPKWGEVVDALYAIEEEELARKLEKKHCC